MTVVRRPMHKLVEEDCPGQEYHVEQKDLNEPIRSWQDKQEIRNYWQCQKSLKTAFSCVFPFKELEARFVRICHNEL